MSQQTVAVPRSELREIGEALADAKAQTQKLIAAVDAALLEQRGAAISRAAQIDRVLRAHALSAFFLALRLSPFGFLCFPARLRSLTAGRAGKRPGPGNVVPRPWP